MIGHDVVSFDARRRATKRHAMVDAAIARLRDPPKKSSGGGPRLPTTSAYAFNLVGTDEFYAHAGFTKPTPTSSAIAPDPKSNKPQQPTPSAITSGIHIPGGLTSKAAGPSTSAAATASTGHDVVSGSQPSPHSPITFGKLKQGSLSGSRWASASASPEVANTITPQKAAVSAPTPADSFHLMSPIAEQSSNPRTIRRFDEVTLSSETYPETVGSIRVATPHEHTYATLEFWIRGDLIFSEPLYSCDIFTETTMHITFQAYAKEWRNPTWKMEFRLPYQSTGLGALIYSRLRPDPRPLTEGPTNKRLSTNGLSSTLSLPTTPQDASGENSQLLINLDAEEETQPQPAYVSSSIQALMGLMTDDRSIGEFLGRLNEPTGGAFLDEVFRIAGHPPMKESSPQMLSAAKTLVLELYSQSEIFQSLSEEVMESLVRETSEKLLVKALAVQQVQVPDAAESAKLDNQSGSSRPHATYSAGDLLALRDRALTIDEKLLTPEALEPKAKTSSQSGTRSRKSSTIPSWCNTPAEQPATEISPIKSSAIEVWPPTKSINNEHPMFKALQYNLQPQAKNAPDSNRNDENKRPPISGSSVHTGYTQKLPAHSDPDIQNTFNFEQPLVSFGDQGDDTSQLVDPQLLKDLAGLKIGDSPPVSSPASVSNGPSTQLQTPKAQQVPSIMEVSNVDLKGNPGLAASMWANTSADPYPSRVRRNNSTRTGRASRVLPPVLPRPVSPIARQYQYDFVPKNFQPRLTTVLVTDPVTGEVHEVQGVEKVGASVPFTGTLSAYQGHPAPFHSPGLPSRGPVPPPGLPASGSSVFQGQLDVPRTPPRLFGGSPEFSPNSSTPRAPLSPVRPKNANIPAQTPSHRG